MRTIKFRGFNKKNGVWLYGFYLQNRGAHFVAPDEFANGKTWEDYEVVPESVGQFTGLTDRNGQEVYEGDIVEIVTQGIRQRGVVFWHKAIDDNYPTDYAPFDVFNVGWYVRVTLDDRAYMDCMSSVVTHSEVVGRVNIGYNDKD